MTKQVMLVRNVSKYIQGLDLETMESSAFERMAQHQEQGLGSRVIAMELMSGQHGQFTIPNWLEEIGYRVGAESMETIVNLFDHIAAYLGECLNKLLKPPGVYTVEQSVIDGSVQVMYEEGSEDDLEF